MALWVRTLAFLLALPSFLCVQDPALSSPSMQKGDRSPAKCRVPELWDSRADFTPKQLSYNPGEMVTWSCPKGHRPSLVNTICMQSGNWNPPSIHCVGFCTVSGNLPPSVSTTSIQAEFPIGQRVWVTCRPEQFEEGSFPVQCVDRAGHPEWDISHVSCIGKPESKQAGIMPWAVAMAVAIGLLLSAGALVMWVVLSRRHQAARSSTEQEHYEELQPQGPLDIYSQMQTPLPAVPGVARRGIPDSSLQA
ncbi:uncharacterized protein LOC112548663 [Alligator sinensis]|uniref:Uncharacterized protein LOC112548663 n=1 Tax=Alligator sinensis TaxID=38654 RepID=A0A3Q0FYL0_ALLSI|nr:uncharacterized protein LOC112548663 [Alligator sinensis]